MGDNIEVHLYVIMWPNYALVASNLPPDEFGKHYTLGSSRYFHGQVVFAEIDPNYRNDFLKIDKYMMMSNQMPLAHRKGQNSLLPIVF